MSEAANPSAAQPFAIHVIDDDLAFRTALERILVLSGYEVHLYGGAEAFFSAAASASPGCILLDVDMPTLSGLQLQEQLATRGEVKPVIFLTGHGDVAMSVRAVKAGAEDFLLKPVGRAELVDAIERARATLLASHAGRQAMDSLQERLDSLTPREREVFDMVVKGLLNKQIAYQLGNTERTVKAQRAAVMEKMQAETLAELVLIGAHLGIIGARAS